MPDGVVSDPDAAWSFWVHSDAPRPPARARALPRRILGHSGADAAAVGAEQCRILIPETPRCVSDGAYLRANISEEPDFVLAADLTGD